MESRDTSIDSITETLDSLCRRLRALKLELRLPPDVVGLIDAVLAKPQTHEPLLRRLAAARPEMFGTIARAALDRLPDEDDGYPWIYLRDSDSANPDLADEVAEFLENTAPPGEDGDSGNGSDRESDTDAEDLLTDEDLEDALHEVDDWGHAERRRVRASIRAGSQELPSPLPEILAEIRSEWEADEEAVAAYAEADAEEEVGGTPDWLRGRIEETQALLDSEGSEEDPLAILLDLPSVKKPRLDVGSIPDEDLSETLAALEAKIDVAEARADARDRKLTQLAGAASTLRDLLEDADVRRDEMVAAPYRTVLEEADRCLEDDSSAGTAASLDDLVGRLRAAIDALSTERPSLKRKRDAYEALAEIREEQANVDQIIDRHAFARLVQEIAQDFRSEPRFDAQAVAALQEAAEGYLVDLFGASGRAAIHAGRTFIEPKDIQFVRDLRGDR